MIILHLSVVDGDAFLWGEAPAEQRRGRLPRAMHKDLARGRARKVERHPHDAGPMMLDEALTTACDALAPSTSNPAPQQLWAWLPTRGAAPVVTSRLLGATNSTSRARPRIAPWALTGQKLEPTQVVEVLTRCAGAHMPAPGVMVGSDLAFWIRGLELAAGLVARQQYVPSLAESGGVARWQPVPIGADDALVAALAGEMPSVTRAITSPGSEQPVLGPRSALDSFLGVYVDAIVRQAIAGAADAPAASTAAHGGRRTARHFDSVHDAWTSALASVDPAVSNVSDASEIDELQAATAEWARPLAEAQDAPFRLLFRLEEPPEDAHTWRLSYHLQARFDPSLLLPVQELFDAPATGTGPRRAAGGGDLLAQHGFDVARHLLAPLGQAAGVSDAIAASLHAGQLGAAELDDGEAFTFLAEHSVSLERAGFTVQLPSWFTRDGRSRLALRGKVRSSTSAAAPSSGLSLDSIAQVEWSVALGDTTLTRAELRAIARAKVPLVRVRGEWVQVDPGELAVALERWDKSSRTDLSVREIVRMSLTGSTPGAGSGSVAGAPELQLVGIDATGWVGELLDRLDGTAAFAELDAPATLDGTLRPYQQRGFSWLAFLRELGFGACLADDMGLGKTVQTLASIAHDHEVAASTGKGAGASAAKSPPPVLLICPTSVLGNWQREAARFTPGLDVLVHHGTGRLDGAAFTRAARASALVVTSYALLHRDHARLAKVKWAGMVLDEAQNIKNPETKQARAARDLACGWRVALTGTPVENHVGDMWSIMEFLNPGLLGTRAAFRRNFLLPIHNDGNKDAAARLRRVTGPFVLRRLKTDRSIISDLPMKNEMRVRCSLTAEQGSLYQAVLDDIQERLESSDPGIERRGLVLALMTKLKQVCNHPAQLLGDGSELAGRSGKLERITEMMGEVLEAGERALVFTQFTSMGAMLRRHLEETFGHEVLYLHGSTTSRGRDEMVERFQRADRPGAFVLSLKAGGTGLNLTAANHVFHFDRWWNPAVEDQATDRAFRIGQKLPVSVHKFVCLGTFEERIDELIQRKQSVAGSVVGAGEAWLTELSNEQLRDIFALDAAEVMA